MLRLLIVADHASEASEMLGRTRTVATEAGRTVETVLVMPDGGAVRRWAALAAPEARLVPVSPELSDEERLDAGLLLRPFVGDGRRSLHQRLASLGSDSVVTPAHAGWLRELSA